MELYQKTAAELSAMLKNKEVSSVELTKAAFARTAAVEDKVGAYITLTEEHALETAAAIDAKRAAGEELPGDVLQFLRRDAAHELLGFRVLIAFSAPVAHRGGRFHGCSFVGPPGGVLLPVRGVYCP